MPDDKDNSVKIQALNALKAFSGIRKFRLKIQVSLQGPQLSLSQGLGPLICLG